MLVLSRRVNETVYIGDHIRVTVIDLNNGQIRLGFEADEDIPIYREEIYHRMQNKKIKAKA